MTAPLLVALAAAARPHVQSPNEHYIHTLDCSVKQLAFEFAQNKTQRNLRSVYTALNLSNCTSSLSADQLADNARVLVLGETTSARESTRSNPASAITVYVSINGSDTNPGTAALPFATLQRAVQSVSRSW